MSQVKKIIKLKRPDEIDFNKATGSYHLGYEIACRKLKRKHYVVITEYQFYGNTRVYIQDLRGNKIEEDYPLSFFKKISKKP